MSTSVLVSRVVERLSKRNVLLKSLSRQNQNAQVIFNAATTFRMMTLGTRDIQDDPDPGNDPGGERESVVSSPGMTLGMMTLGTRDI